MTIARIPNLRLPFIYLFGIGSIKEPEWGVRTGIPSKNSPESPFVSLATNRSVPEVE